MQEQERVLELIPELEGYTVQTDKASYRAKVLVWAGGEFSRPKTAAFYGAEHCRHSSAFGTWDEYSGQDALIIGGYESGIDAALHLVELGKRALVVSKGEPWRADEADPSEILSPFTRQRLVRALRTYPGRLVLRGNLEVVSVNRLSERYIVETAEGEFFDSEHPPIAAIGFESALMPIRQFFAWEGSTPQFTEEDESTLHPGLFYSGPSLVQHHSKFCFIYKFRARFGVIACSIAKRLGYPQPDLEDDRRRGFSR